jgi:hypothetical protein
LLNQLLGLQPEFTVIGAFFDMSFALKVSPQEASHERVDPAEPCPSQLRVLSQISDDVQRRAQQQLRASPYREVQHTTCSYHKGMILLKGQVSSYYLKQIEGNKQQRNKQQRNKHMGQLYFHQDCQVCGRPMNVRIELLGQRIRCGHCRGECDTREPNQHALGRNLAAQRGLISEMAAAQSSK